MYSWLDSAISRYYKDEMETVLNIGHGGPVYKHLNNKINKLTSLDLNPDIQPDITASIEKMDMIDDNSVDLIFCMEVIEHVKNPFKGASEVHRILKPGGLFIASTVFIYPIHEVPCDYFRFTKYGLQELFNKMTMMEMKERNKYVFSIFCLLLRLGINKNRYITFLSLLTFPLLLLLLPLFIIFNLFIDSDYATTGYYFIYKK